MILPSHSAPLALLLVASAAGAGPDLFISNMNGAARWGVVDGIGAYSFTVVTCNSGDAPAMWAHDEPDHPTHTQNVFRIAGGNIEQIGLGWAMHPICALQATLCGTCEFAQTSCDAVGKGCSTTTSMNYTAAQVVLGPRSDIDPSAGDIPMPFPTQNQTGDAIYKRVQVPDADLDPALNAGAVYLAETIVVTGDESAGAHSNNSGSRAFIVGPYAPGSGYPMTFTGPAHAGSAISAWAAADPSVTLAFVDVPGDGRIWVGSRAMDNGNGTRTYFYAVYNLNSDRAVGAIVVPSAGAALSSPGFRDISYHSGEVYDGTDWPATLSAESVSWATQDHGTNPFANAIYWGTMYTFTVVADTAPTLGSVQLNLFKPGADATQTLAAWTPSSPPPPPICDGDSDFDLDVDFADITTTLANFGQEFGAPYGPGDADHDYDVDFADITRILERFGQSCE